MDFANPNSSSLYQSEHSMSLASLVTHGGRTFEPTPSRYVVHTHTVPLATTVDNQYLLSRRAKTTSLFHGYQAGEKSSLHCSNRSCMYIRSNGTRSREVISHNCPCTQVTTPEGKRLQPLCWLVYVRSLNHNLVDPGLEARTFDPAEIMFCQTSQGLFDNSYGGPLRDETGATGWGQVNQKQLVPLLRCCYWFRKFDQKLGLSKKIEKYAVSVNLLKLKRVVSQSIHTINSLLLKKMIAFSPEIVGYRKLAEQTARAFSALLEDYCRPVTLVNGLPSEPEEGFYSELKALNDLVKSSFHRETRGDRLAWLSSQFTSKALGAILGSEIRALRSYIEARHAESGSDYTLSAAYVFRCVTMSQSRAMGYLPDAIAECKRLAFRMNVNRDVEHPEDSLLRFHYHAVQRGLNRGGVPRHFMAIGHEKQTEKGKMLFSEVFSRIELPLKVSASTDSLVRDGGKLEDARQLLRLAAKQKWSIPVRDLDDHSVIEWISVIRETDVDEEYTRPLFWLSYNIVLNYWIDRGEYTRDHYTVLPYGGGQFKPDIFSAKIVHISEPGKERNLTKSTSIMAWFLTPGSKLVQGTIAELKEHRAGLLESGHEWRHQKRVSVMSDESGFIYDMQSGKTHSDVRHVFKDWTQSTDFIGKMVGWAHLKGALDYAGFPRAYGSLILSTIIEPQPVSEVVILQGDLLDERIPVVWQGFIREGYMMGNPMTKSILHLVHISEVEATLEFLRRKGVEFKPGTKAQVIGRPARIDRTLAMAARDYVL